VAPFERGAQRLLPLGRGAVAGRRQQLQAVLHRFEQRPHAERRRARRGQLDRERQAVQRAADLDHRRGIGFAQREPAVDRVRALREQRDRAELQRLRRGQHLARHGQRPEAKDALAAEPKGRLACDDDTQRGRGVDQLRGEPGDVVEQVLGIVEREQHLERRHRAEEGGDRLAVTGLDAERRGDRAGQRGRLRHRRELDPAHALRIRVAPRVQQVLRQKRFADSARAHDAHEPVTVHQRAERIQLVRASEQRRQPGGQVRA
jgi:hypothetical protein